jgi:hypothetical protein
MSESKIIKGKLIQHATELIMICPDPFPILFGGFGLNAIRITATIGSFKIKIPTQSFKPKTKNL